MGSPAIGFRADGPIGRDAEGAVVDAFLDRASIAASALVLSGPAGIGKSTVWRAGIAEAGRRGFRTLVTRAVEAEAELAFAGLADLLEPALDDVADQLPEPQRLALGVALQRVPEPGTPPPALAISLGAAAAVRALALRGPVLIAVDDLPWLDAPSGRVLDFVVRRVGDVRLGFLPAVRTTAEAPEGPPIEFAGTLERLVIGPLDIDAIDALLRRHLDVALPRPDLAWVHRESRGNAFFALELGRALQRTGARPGLEVPTLATGGEALVQSRLDSLPDEARLPLAVVAATSQPTADLVLAACPGADPALAAAVRARVLEIDAARVRFSHPLLASGAYGRLNEDERRQLHARLAAVIADPEQRARHLALATVAPDAIVAVQLDTAAAIARNRGAPEAAGELQLQASRLTPPPDATDLHRRVLSAAESFIQAGDPARARAILEAHVDRVEPGPERADALRLLADVRSGDDWEAKLALLDRALAEAGPDAALRGRLLEARSQTFHFLLLSAGESLANATEALVEARRQDDPAVLCSALASAIFAKLNVGDRLDRSLRDELMALSDQVEHLRVFQWPAYAHALTEVHTDRLESADRTLAMLQRRASDLGDWDSLPLIASAHANVAYLLGRWTEARDLARQGERGSRQNGQRTGLTWSLVMRALLEFRLGNDGPVDQLLSEAFDTATAIRAGLYVVDVDIVAGLRALELGDAEAAESALRRAGQRALEEGYVGLLRRNVLPDWAEAMVAAGRLEEATALIAAHEEILRRRDAPAALAATLRAKALAASAAGDEASAEAGFLEALSIHDRVPSPFPRARTLLAYGEALRRARQRGRGRAALSQAAAIFAALPAPRWLARAEAELERTGHRAPGARLSPTEQQIADLVTAGRTNREVAETLFMSPHTVEAHLTRIYRSLGVRGRTELAAVLRTRPDGRVEGSD
jgi:DNA-binding CsgD family transcriptional regulator